MTQSDNAAKDAKPVRIDTTLQKGLQVLEALARADGGRGVTELSRELNLTKSNTFRLLQSLSALGYVRSSESRLYSPTLKIWQLAQAVMGNLDLPGIAAPFLQALSAETGETIYLAVPDGLKVVYIDKIESTKPIRTWNPIGGHAPIHCVGTGKAMLAADYARYRPQLEGKLERYTDKTITSLDRLDSDMAETRERGVAIDIGEFREQVRSFGSAIVLPDGTLVGAIGVSVPEVNLGPGREAEICRSVLHAAAGASAALAQI